MIRKRKGGTIGWRVEGGRQGRKNRWIWLPYTIILGFADVVVVQLPSCVWLFATPWTAAHQTSCPSLYPRVCSNSCPLSRWCHPTISSFVASFSSCPKSFPASEFFPVSQFFISGGLYWNLNFSISPSKEYSGLISFRIDWSDLLVVQGTLKSLL